MMQSEEHNESMNSGLTGKLESNFKQYTCVILLGNKDRYPEAMACLLAATCDL